MYDYLYANADLGLQNKSDVVSFHTPVSSF